ncbi:MAG: antitoxin [Candidatus Asgardarchaeia archaeon]
MSTDVFSFRIPKKIKEEMEKISIDGSKEIRKFIERKLKEYRKGEMLERAKKLRRKMKVINSAELIREGREQ